MGASSEQPYPLLAQRARLGQMGSRAPPRHLRQHLVTALVQAVPGVPAEVRGLMMLYCPDGEHEIKVRFNPVPGERWCPEHGCALSKLPKSGLSDQQTAREGLPGEKAARSRFRQVVTARPCFFLDIDDFGERRRPDHVCTYPLDAHHIIPKGWIKRELSMLPADELVELAWNPLIGAPLCRGAHEAVERGVADIYWHELNPDLRSLVEQLVSRCPQEVFDLEAVSTDAA